MKIYFLQEHLIKKTSGDTYILNIPLRKIDVNQQVNHINQYPHMNLLHIANHLYNCIII